MRSPEGHSRTLGLQGPRQAHPTWRPVEQAGKAPSAARCKHDQALGQRPGFSGDGTSHCDN